MQESRRPLRIDIAVHGRFYAFHLARHLIAHGHDVRVLTNYPKFVARRFGLPADCVKSFVWHGLLSRLIHKLKKSVPLPDMEAQIHRAFGRWVVKKVRKDADVVHIFSGVAEELILALRKVPKCPLVTVVRGSAHIKTQLELLREEEIRCGFPVEHPSDWMVAREEREYALADKIVVLSSFAQNSFEQQGVGLEKLWLIPLGVDVSRFRPQDGAARGERILSGAPLHVLMVGSFTARKGGLDFIEVARKLKGVARFRFVGDTPDGDSMLRQQAEGLVEFVPRVPEFDLPAQYEWGDIFCFPTIEDGYAVVLAQAQAAGLPILTTTNCSGPDLVEAGQTGWVLPIRSPVSFVRQLKWCDAHRAALAEMANAICASPKLRDWGAVAEDFVEHVRAAIGRGDKP